MTTRNRILSLALSLLMVVALFAPIATVFAAESLQIIKASDNGGTSDTSTAREAIAGLGSSTTWYSANRNILTDKVSIATFTLKQSAFVDSVAIAFYYADQRSYEFSIEYSMNKEDWEVALDKTWSVKQTTDNTAETFTFPEVEALYLRVKIYDARVLATGASNNYGAFYTFEAFGEFDPDGIVCPSTICPEGEVWAITAYQTEGPLHTNVANRATAACPNLRLQDDAWFSANASSTDTVAAVFVLPIEAELFEIQLDWYNGAERGYEYALYTSLDNETWTEIVAPGTISTGEATTTIDLTADDDYEGTAVYVKLVSADGYCRNADGSVATNQWIALSEIHFIGEFVEGGIEPSANYDDYNNWINIQKDLTEDLYTADSWKAFDDAIKAVDTTLGLVNQDVVDAGVTAIVAAYANLKFNNVSEIQISHSYYSDMAGGSGWTNDCLFFSEPGYTLDQYKVKGMTMQNWTRIFVVPTEEEGVYEISNIIAAGTKVSDTEIVPENDYGTGFVLSLNYNGNNVEAAGSQYASEEFGNRNEAARVAMDLKVGDKVQLNNVIYTAEDFENEGEEMQAAWLETDGTWKHRYWSEVGLGDFTPTVINRKSGQTDAEGNYLARDEFDGFVSNSTLTKIANPAEFVYATDNGGTTATSHAIEAVAGLGSGTSWYSANRNNLPDKISIADFYLAQLSAIDGIEIAFYFADQRIYEYSIEYSADNGATWNEIVPVTESIQQAADKTVEEIYFDDIVEAQIIRVKIHGATVVETGLANNYGAFYSIAPIGTKIIGGEKTDLPAADYTQVNTWSLIKLDLTEELYTEDSWAAFEAALAAITEGYDISEQALLDAEIAAIREAYFALTFKDLEGIQISHAYYSDMTGGPAWTNASLFFNESGYTLDQYKVSGMDMDSWIRIFAEPTDKEGVYSISQVISAGTPVTADEVVPDDGFVIAININEDIPDEVPYGSQYASQEFANRNKAAFEAMNLAVGDLVQLNNVLFSAADFENEGEDMQAAWLETEGTWKHRYWNTVGLGDFTPTVINRPSNKTNDNGEFLARDEFDGFTTVSTLTKYEAPAYKLGDLDEDGEVGLSDLTLMSQTLAGWDSDINRLAADLDSDGEIGLSDLTVISQLLAGWNVELG